MKSWLGREVHIYYFVIFGCLGFISGIVLTFWSMPVTGDLYLYLYISLLFTAAGLIKRRKALLTAVFIGGVLLGLFRGYGAKISLDGYQQYYGQQVVISGKVIDDVNISSGQDLSFKLKDIRINNSNLGGEVWAKARPGETVKRSDSVEVKGFLAEGFGSFSASLTRGEILSLQPTSQYDAGLKVRDQFAQNTENLIPEPERSLGLGYLLGLKTELPEDLQKNIQLLGLTHVVVASGYNLTILVSFTRRLFKNVSKYLSAVTGAGMIFGFILITGFSPSMSRAGLVAGLSLLAWYYGRKIHPLTLILIAMTATLFIRPAYIWGDLGWYLSFAAFYGILVLAPLLHHFFWGDAKPPSAARELFVATLSAQIMTLPIILYSFGNYSFYALLANILILPVVPLSMLATFASGIFGIMGGMFGEVMSLPAVLVLKYCTFVIEKMADLASQNLNFELGLPAVLSLYAMLGLVSLALIYKTKHNFLKDKIIID